MKFALNEIRDREREFIGLQITFCMCACEHTLAHSQTHMWQHKTTACANTKQSNLNGYSPMRKAADTV